MPTRVLLLTILWTLGLIAGTAKADAMQDENRKAEELFERIFQENLARSPVFQTELGMKTHYGEWDDLSEAFAGETQALNKKHLKQLKKLKFSKLNDANQLNYRLMENSLRRDIEFYRWRHHDYPVNQMFGWHAYAPSFLINQHRVDSVEDAQAYIARVEGIATLIDQLIDGMQIREKEGIIPPKFVFPLVISDSQNIIAGKPFAGEGESVLHEDFSRKVAALDIGEKKKAALMEKADSALINKMAPAYEKLIAYLKKLEAKADTRAGAWKFPHGEEFYEAALKRTTTTDLSAEQIHQIGLAEVKRIHGEMRDIMKQVGFKGDLQEFFTFMRDDKRFYYPADKQGRERYMREVDAVIKNMKTRLPDYFISLPKADLTVKRVEEFREQSAGKAFYEAGAVDGSRPAIYYANLYNMKEMPTYQMEALAYHEGIPGHHLQISISRELEGVPQFRKFTMYTAYVEGWGLYAEYLAKEMGMYADPYADFGRLAMELWRACRLVTDTGLHAKKWTREQAIQYLVENTPNVERDARRAIERYIVMPSQATAYKIGMLKILELRENARQKLGNKFDIREFHDQVLKAGAMPLDILEERINLWVSDQERS